MNSLHKKLCRLTVVVPFLFLTVFSARGQVKVSGNNLKLSEVIEQIQEATDYTFFYNVSDIEGVKAASSNVSGTLEEVLNAVFKGTGISYKIQDKRIALKKRKIGRTSDRSFHQDGQGSRCGCGGQNPSHRCHGADQR